MNADPKRKLHKDDYDRAERARRHQEEALDDALKNTSRHPTQFQLRSRLHPPPTTTGKG